jgi:Protein phosphatase 2C
VVRRGVLTVANAGDSRCVLCRGGTAVDMSSDHKPDLPEEAARIEEVICPWALVQHILAALCSPNGQHTAGLIKGTGSGESIFLLLQAGGFVRNGRTCGNLSLSRALGDFEFKRNSAQP